MSGGHPSLCAFKDVRHAGTRYAFEHAFDYCSSQDATQRVLSTTVGITERQCQRRVVASFVE